LILLLEKFVNSESVPKELPLLNSRLLILLGEIELVGLVKILLRVGGMELLDEVEVEGVEGVDGVPDIVPVL
jgi:hypothetical protein